MASATSLPKSPNVNLSTTSLKSLSNSINKNKSDSEEVPEQIVHKDEALQPPSSKRSRAWAVWSSSKPQTNATNDVTNPSKKIPNEDHERSQSPSGDRAPEVPETLNPEDKGTTWSFWPKSNHVGTEKHSNVVPCLLYTSRCV